MIADFPRILTLLRKEKGISQKKAAESLGVSQALLSHYEKGIRECGLAFLVKSADYYNVSCDYLLGRSAEKTGQTISVEEIPDPENSLATNGKENTLKGSVLPLLNKKLLLNSINILFDYLSKYNNKSLTNEVSTYLTVAVYKMFRCVFEINDKNPSWLFSVEKDLYTAFSNSALAVTEAKISSACAQNKVAGFDFITNPDIVEITTESITANYPLAASSLLNLIKNAEFKIKKFEKM
ncbi:MAG: helix-turn-helix transcriptional regulator [Clostridia bacterium]